MASDAIAYDKNELRAIVRSFKAMDDAALAQAKEATSELATYVQGKIKATAATVTFQSRCRRFKGFQVFQDW